MWSARSLGPTITVASRSPDGQRLSSNVVSMLQRCKYADTTSTARSSGYVQEMARGR